MAYFEGRMVTITSPIEARAIEHGLTLAIQEERRNGSHVPPMWVLELQGALHKLWAESNSRHATKVGASKPLSSHGPSRMMDVVKASKILGKTPQAVTADCREGRLDGFLVRGRWEITAASVEARRAEQEQKKSA